MHAYQWSYPADGPRRATQQTPIGFFPLDQQANRHTQQLLRQEAVNLAASQPSRLLVMGDMYTYMATALMAADPSLRASRETIGGLEALKLTNQQREVYFIAKNFAWPADATATILKLPEYAAYPIYVQPSTISRYDLMPIPADRHYVPTTPAKTQLR